MTPITCPCGGFGTAITYAACCGPFIDDGVPPPTCEQLMRSRYTAFARKHAEHLWRTWHPRTRPAHLGPVDGRTWTGLQVLATESGGVDDDAGTVEFTASFRLDDGATGVVREHSRFTRRAGRWFYIDGDELA